MLPLMVAFEMGSDEKAKPRRGINAPEPHWSLSAPPSRSGSFTAQPPGAPAAFSAKPLVPPGWGRAAHSTLPKAAPPSSWHSKVFVLFCPPHSLMTSAFGRLPLTAQPLFPAGSHHSSSLPAAALALQYSIGAFKQPSHYLRSFPPAAPFACLLPGCLTPSSLKPLAPAGLCNHLWAHIPGSTTLHNPQEKAKLLFLSLGSLSRCFPNVSSVMSKGTLVPVPSCCVLL